MAMPVDAQRRLHFKNSLVHVSDKIRPQNRINLVDHAVDEPHQVIDFSHLRFILPVSI